MDWLNISDTNFLLSICISLLIFCAFYVIAAKKQDKALHKVDKSLMLQKQTNQNLKTIIGELRRSNSILADLAGLEIPEAEKTNDFTRVSHFSNAQYASQGSYNVSNANTLPDNAYNTPETDSSYYKLYVGNIDYSASEAELAAHFSAYGLVEDVNIPINRYTGRARGFGFVTFASKSDAERAMSLNGSEFRGRQIQVNFAKEQEAL